MPSVDRYGLPLSGSAAARDAYVAGVDCVLSANTGADEHLARALAADPGFALAQIALARAHFLAEHPRDAMVLAPAAGVFGLIGFSGRRAREAELYEYFRGFAPHYSDDWWFASALAFAACENGRLGEAAPLIERSLGACPRNPHGAHIKAHVHYELGEHRAALDFLEQWLPAYPRQGPMHCHLSWHVALAALALGERERAWRAYREGVHPVGGAWGPPLNVATDSPSFLLRAELAGEPRQARLWSEAREYGLRSFPRAGVWFADVHVALACAAAGDADNAARIARELREREAAGKLPPGAVAPALADAFAAFEARDWGGAADLLEAALPETVRIGGSRAQRDLVGVALRAACAGAGREIRDSDRPWPVC